MSDVCKWLEKEEEDTLILYKWPEKDERLERGTMAVTCGQFEKMS